MTARREVAAFAVVLAALVAALLGDNLFGGKVLSPADVLFVSASFREVAGADYEPANRLLIDPVLQFQPWLEFNRVMFRRGRLPLWNDLAGCGTPHLANAQSAPFDPFYLIAYLGTLPDALAWIAAARLWVAGLGMFLLARSWGLGTWGRWFSGLTFPLCGFVIVWLLFPVTAVAVWMPWLFLATDRVLERPTPRRVSGLAVCVGFAFLSGHTQTSAHVLLAVSAYAVWRLAVGGLTDRGLAAPLAWFGGLALGLALAALTIVPLWAYLGKSPVWADRERERPSPFRLTRPRVLDAACTAVPSIFGSQRRGQPNLARALGVHNLNESAGGYAGLATLAWLAPQAWLVRKRQSRVTFLVVLAAFGFLGAFGVPPVSNLLRALPVMNVTDQRRLTLWVAFALVVLGGVGLDHLAIPWRNRTARLWLSLGAAHAAALVIVALVVPAARPWLVARAERHYTKSAQATAGADPSTYQRRAERQVRQTLAHVPRVCGLTALEIAGLGALALFAHRGLIPWTACRLVVMIVTLGEMFSFGFGLNPAIERRADRPIPAVVARLQAHVGQNGRILGIGEELPPNVAMRYGLADPRNYDSVELGRSLDWFAALYEPGDGPARSSRRTITWAGVIRARDVLRDSGVGAVVAATPPPPGVFHRVERVGAVWVAYPAAAPFATESRSQDPVACILDNGRIDVTLDPSHETTIVVRQTFDRGWRASVDGRPMPVAPYRNVFLSVRVPAGAHRLQLIYDPDEVRLASVVSAAAALMLAVSAASPRPLVAARFLGERLGRLRHPRLESIP